MKLVNGKYANAKVFTDNVENTALKQIENMVNHELTEKTKVRIMPDAHAGKGSTIGTTIKLPINFDDWKVPPNIVGVDIGCFTGDTKVRLADGRSLTFLELIDEDSKGIENFVYGVSNGEVSMARLHAPRKTDTVEELVYVTLDNGEVIKCTVSHKFILRDGKEIEAKHLKENMSLMPLYIEKAEDIEDKLRDYSLSKLTEGMGEYHAVYMPNEGDYVMAHILADNYNYENDPTLEGKIYEGGRTSFVRHHDDFDKYNNNPPNVVRMGFKEHWRVHADNVGKTNAMGLTGFARAIELDPDLPSRAGSLRAEATWNGPNAKRNYEEKAKLMKEMNESGIVNTKEQREASRQRQLTNNTSTLPEQMKDPEFVLGQRVSRYARIAQECMNKYGKINEETWEKARLDIAKNSPKYSSLPQLLMDSNMTIEDLLARKLKKKRNHKVIKVEVKNVEPTDVYCLTNFSHGNFALDAGVFVNNCAIMMYKLSDKDIDLQKLDSVVNEFIPAGFNVHNKPQNIEFTKKAVENLTFSVAGKRRIRVHNSLGTLGGGNHFIELGVDGDGDYWLSVHSGSRGLGVQVATYHQNVAIEKLKESQVNLKEIIDRLKLEGRHREIQETIARIKSETPAITKEMEILAYLQGEDLKRYLNDMDIAQKYANTSRSTMLDIIVEQMEFTVVDKFDSVHNFIEHDNFKDGIIRKGATSAKKGERLVIPLNMRDGSIIAMGKGNEDWNNSAPHGAGRMMSRTQARNELSLDDFREQLKGVHSSSVGESTLDEAPGAYKPAKEILEYIKPTVDVLHIVKPVYNFKSK